MIRTTGAAAPTFRRSRPGVAMALVFGTLLLSAPLLSAQTQTQTQTQTQAPSPPTQAPPVDATTEAAAQLAARAAEQSAGDDPLMREIAGSLALNLHRSFTAHAHQMAVIRQQYGEGLPPERAEILRRNFEQSVLHPQLPLYAARAWAPMIRANVSEAQMKQAQFATTGRLKERGIGRLPADRLALHVRDVLDQLKGVDDETCKQIFVSADRSAMQTTTMGHLRTMPMPRFVELARLHHDAALAEITGTPPAITVSPEQAKEAFALYRQAIRKRFLEQVPADVLARYTVPLKDLSASDACLLGRHSVEALFDMPEPAQSRQLLAYVRELAGEPPLQGASSR